MINKYYFLNLRKTTVDLNHHRPTLLLNITKCYHQEQPIYKDFLTYIDFRLGEFGPLIKRL